MTPFSCGAPRIGPMGRTYASHQTKNSADPVDRGVRMSANGECPWTLQTSPASCTAIPAGICYPASSPIFLAEHNNDLSYPVKRSFGASPGYPLDKVHDADSAAGGLRKLGDALLRTAMDTARIMSL